MNRRDFVVNSLMTGLTGIASGELLANGQASVTIPAARVASPQQPATRQRVYARLLDPREHPDYTRRHVQPPNWDTFGGRTHLMTLRDFKIEKERITGYVERIDKYVEKAELGDVLWVSYPILTANNLGDLLDEIKRRNLFLFDLWGYVPGSGPGGYWQQFQVPADVFKLLESKLGDHWLGMDNGEQDGRYIGGYTAGAYPASASRLQQHLNFQRHFERLTDELGSKMATLVSLNFGHYFLKEGLYTLIGAETAQALPNGQVYYAFIRGAGKQYGVPWFGNASVWNRWGWKEYGPEHHVDGFPGGPTKGTSLSLMKRLLYSQVLYNSMMVGFEGSFFSCEKFQPATAACEGEGLSPIGKMQRSMGKWIQEAGAPGVMVTPIAVMVDFFAGWTFPRHLYVNDVYRVWGNLPYEPGDYLTDGVLDMLYPGYQNSSYYHDESGFLTPTPYGDAADCILSDTPSWLLARYPMIVVAGGLEGGAEIHDKLTAYVENGGHLLITAGSLAKLPGGLAGVKAEEGRKHIAARKNVRVGKTNVAEDRAFDLQALSCPKSARILAEISGIPAAVEALQGKGRLTVLASPFGVSETAASGTDTALAAERRNGVDKPLTKPFPLLKHVRAILDETFRTQMLFEAGENLSLITCRKGPGEYTLGISNNTWRQQPFNIVSHCGRIESVKELPLDQSEKGAVGYVPEGLEKTNLGTSDEKNIAGGDVRLFAVRVREESVEVIAHAVPPPRPRGRALPLREARSIKEEVLARPTFFEHFDSVVVDWRYLWQREKEELKRESRWIGLQKLNILVDLTSGINLFPDLRLINNIESDYAASMATIEDVMAKMEILHAQDLILAFHRLPENNFTPEQTWKAFETTLRKMCEHGKGRGITIHLRMTLYNPPKDLQKAVEFMGKVGAPNFRLAPSTAVLMAKKTNPQEAASLLKDKVGLWLVSTPQLDLAGRTWNTNAPVEGYQDRALLAKFLAIAPEAPLVFDAQYKDRDEEYLDVKCIREMLASASSFD